MGRFWDVAEQWNMGSRDWRLKTSLISILFTSLLLVGCVPEAQLPTAVPLAIIPSATATLASGPTLPPTFTPDPSGTPRPTEALQPLSTRPDASITPTLPTSTPRPTRTPTPTNTRPPTETPIPTEPSGIQSPQVIHHNRSRIGLHVILHNHADIMRFVRDTRPAVMKGVGALGFLTDVKEASPNTVTIGRVDDIFIQNYEGEPEEAAREYVAKHLQTYRLNPGVDYWEGWNEPDPGLQWMSWYTRFEQERVKVMAQHGFRSAIGGFPPGVPEMNEFELFIPAVETALQYDGILTLHEGDLGWGNIQQGYGSALPGYPFYADRGSSAFRYRWFYRELLEPRDLVIPLVVSELFFGGWHMMSINEAVDDVVWYDLEARKDPYVIGFTVFTAGANSHWEEFDVNRMLPQLNDYVRSQN